ncbi:MAG: hypothetical protein IJY46_07930 [Lentisphaeria bacterium]|nr:hypothetical protein [Lentisphaeria bacterium]
MLKRKLALIMLIAICGCGLFAAPWSTHNARRRPETLMVIGNYHTPYVLAETYHGLTNQPYLRVMQDGKLYLVLPKVIRGIAPQELAGVIDSLALKRIVIIGDERFVSLDFEKTLRKTNIKATPIVRIYGENWLRIAQELDDLLNIGHLSGNFRENLQDANIRTNPAQLQPRPIQKKADAPAAQDAPAEVPATKVD